MAMTDTEQERLSALETDVRHVAHSVETLANNVTRFITEIRSELRDIREGSKITWPLIFTAIGTFTSILVIAGALHYQSQQPIYIALDNLTKIVDSHVQTPMHIGTIDNYARFQERINNLEKTSNLLLDQADKNNNKIIELITKNQELERRVNSQ